MQILNYSSAALFLDFLFQFLNSGDIKLWAGHMFDENYEVPTKPPLYLFEGKIKENLLRFRLT